MRRARVCVWSVLIEFVEIGNTTERYKIHISNRHEIERKKIARRSKVGAFLRFTEMQMTDDVSMNIDSTRIEKILLFVRVS